MRYQPRHVVVRLSTETTRHREIAVKQLRSAVANGCTTSGYIWCYFDEDPVRVVRESLHVVTAAAVPISMVWLDVEDELSVANASMSVETWLWSALRALWPRRVGIYTARWFWERHVREPFNFVPLWAAQYDHQPTLESVELFGGWPRELVWGHQYSADEIDLNVFDQRAT